MTKYSHQNAVDLFVRMVQVDSPSFSESAMVDFIENEVKTLGWDCKILRQRINMRDLEDDVKERLPADELEKETEQIQIVIEADEAGKDKAPVFFAAHIDTVEPGKGIKPVFTDDGKITSDGTTVLGSDDKSGLPPSWLPLTKRLNPASLTEKSCWFLPRWKKRDCSARALSP